MTCEDGLSLKSPSRGFSELELAAYLDRSTWQDRHGLQVRGRSNGHGPSARRCVPTERVIDVEPDVDPRRINRSGLRAAPPVLGTDARTWVPRPAPLSIISCPFTSFNRSCMLTSPRPPPVTATAGSNPAPRS